MLFSVSLVVRSILKVLDLNLICCLCIVVEGTEQSGNLEGEEGIIGANKRPSCHCKVSFYCC